MKYCRWMPGDCAGEEIILGSIGRPLVSQLKYLQDEYWYNFSIFAHFRQLKNMLEKGNISGGCRVTVPDRRYYWGRSSGHGLAR
jgi:hypothetical protein